MDKLSLKKTRQNRRRLRVKRKIKLAQNKLRLCIFRSNKGFFAQIIDDSKGHTLVSASTQDKDFPEMKTRGNKEAAKELGKLLATKAVPKGIKAVVFDRNGYLYHGKIKAFADAAREHGLEF
ncbi:MAG: 50S ribosomal protein L18 [Spirochaetes bacterium]|nr:MAG: 50S ribosomal protein L18 [Spirochaetota bacterium]